MGISQMTMGTGDFQSGLEASQEAARLYRQTGDWFGQAFALGFTGNLAAFQNDGNLAEQALTEAIRLGREHDSKLVLCFAQGVMSKYVFLPRGEIEAARLYAEESVRASREIGLLWAVGQSELILARIASIYQQWDEARRHILAALEVFQELRDPLLLNMSNHDLADVELRAGNLAEARKRLHNCILSWQGSGGQAFIAHELESLAYIERAQDQPERAARLLGAAEALQEGLGTTAAGVDRLADEYQNTVVWLHSRLDETAFGARWSEGCGMRMDQAIAYALEQ
jgi:MalT-like TPR region